MTGRPIALDLTFEIVSPLFLSGADQREPELRAASVRGAVRSWYRALDPEFRRREVLWFGAADQPDADRVRHNRKSPWSVRVLRGPSATFVLDRRDYNDNRFNQGRPPDRTNGILYAGFSLLDRFNERAALDASSGRTTATFGLRLVAHIAGDGADGLTPVGFAAVLGSFWLLGHLGGLGSRARRGFGSVQLVRVDTAGSRALPPEYADIVERLQPAPTSSVEAWCEGVAATMTWLRERFGGARSGATAQSGHFGEGAWVRAFRSSHDGWPGALNEVGASLQAFRRAQRADRLEVLDELALRQRRSLDGRRLRRAPRRVAFGLPLTFRYGLTPKRVKDAGVDRLHPDTLVFRPSERLNGGESDAKLERYAGPLSFRIVHLRGGWHAVAVRLAAAPVGTFDPDEHETTPRTDADVIDNKTELDTIDRIPVDGDAIIDEWRATIARSTLEVPV